MNKQQTIISNHGALTVDTEGNIIDRQLENDDADGGGHLALITRFDVAEWRTHWGNPDTLHIDILDLGYWHTDDSGKSGYEQAHADWRREIAQGLMERQPAGRGDAA